MRAITLLYRAGLTRATVASAIDQTPHSIRLYERGERFPAKEPFLNLVKLAESRGMTLLARDFIDNGESNNGSE
jgi:transcriptional regulator with XRE-family HTH domain